MAELTDEILAEWLEAMNDNTEITKLLGESLKSSAKSAKDGIKGLSDEAFEGADTFDALNQQVRNSTDEMEEMEEVAEKVNDAWKTMKVQTMKITQAFASTTENILASGESFGIMRKFIDPIGDIISSLIKGMGDVVGGMLKMGTEIPILGGLFKGLGKTIEAITGVAGTVASALFKFGANLVIDGIEQLWAMFEKASSAGVLFANGLTEMNRQRGDLSLTTQEYTDVIRASRDQLSVFGGSIAEGAKRLAAVGKESQQFSVELRAMGISYREQAENTAEFMESLQRTGQLRAMTDQQVATASAEYQKNLVIMSSLTGKSIETMKKERDESLKNMAFQAELAKMDPAVRTEMEAALVSMPAGMKQAFQESVIFGKVMTDTGAIVSGAAPMIEQFANSVRDGSASNEEAFQTFRDDLRASAPELRKNLSQLAAAGMAELLGKGNSVTGAINTFADSLYKEISRAENTSADIVETMLVVGENQEEKIKQIIRGLDAQREMQDALLKIIEDKALPAAGKMFELISTTMTNGLLKFVEIIEKHGQSISDITVDTKKATEDASYFDSFLTAIGLTDLANTEAFNAAQIQKTTGKSVQQIMTDKTISQIKEGGDTNKAQVQLMYGDDFRKNIATNERVTAAATIARAQREINELKEEILELKREQRQGLPEDTGVFSDSRSEQITELNESIKRLEELQARSNAIAEGTKRSMEVINN